MSVVQFRDAVDVVPPMAPFIILIFTCNCYSIALLKMQDICKAHTNIFGLSSIWGGQTVELLPRAHRAKMHNNPILIGLMAMQPWCEWLVDA